MIARRIDLLPISFDKFAAVSGTLLDRDLAIVRTWQSATRPQPTSAQDRLSPLGFGAPVNGRRPAVVDLVGDETLSDSDPFTLTMRQPNPLDIEMSLRVTAAT